jgi:hypothetical protein
MKYFILDGKNGLFIPNQVYSMFKKHPHWNWSNVPQWACSSVDNGPEDPQYWEAWDAITLMVCIKEQDYSYYLYQDNSNGDVWIRTI